MIPYTDLLNVGYKKHGETVESGLDCLSVTRILLERHGVPVPKQSDEMLLGLLRSENGPWKYVGPWSTRVKEGDIALLRGPENDPFGVGVVVIDRPIPMLVTSLVGKGVLGLNSRAAKRCVLGMYRYSA